MRAQYFERGIIQVKEMHPRDVGSLTPRRQDILRNVAEGKPNKEIARAMGISSSTVKNHLTKIYRYLEVSSRSGAVIAMLPLVEQDNGQADALSSRPLTPAETALMILLVTDDTGGITAKELARKTYRSKETINHHLASIYSKLGVSNRVEAIIKFRAQLGLTEPGA